MTIETYPTDTGEYEPLPAALQAILADMRDAFMVELDANTGEAMAMPMEGVSNG